MEDAHQVEAAVEAHQRSTRSVIDTQLEHQKYVLDMLKNTLDPASKTLNKNEAIQKIDMLQQANQDPQFKDMLGRLGDYIKDTPLSDLSNPSKLSDLIQKAAQGNQVGHDLNSHLPHGLPISADSKNPFAAKVPEADTASQAKNNRQHEERNNNQDAHNKHKDSKEKTFKKKRRQAPKKKSFWASVGHGLLGFFTPERR